MDRTFERGEWVGTLKEFTERNAGRVTILEVDGVEFGAQEEESGLPLRGIAFDPRDGRVEIMLGEQADTATHLTRTVERPERIDVTADERGRDRALRIVHEGGQTVLRFTAATFD
jgi:hypothetical protein